MPYRWNTHVAAHKVSFDNRPRGYKTFLCSTQLRTKFQLLIKTKYRHIKMFLALCLSDIVFSMLLNVKMPTIVGILLFMSMEKGYVH